MAGYVVLKLVKKFTRTCTSEKRKAFVRIPNSLKARDQDVPVLEDYTTCSMGGTGEPRLSVLNQERGYKIVTCIHAIATHTVVSPPGSVADGGY